MRRRVIRCASDRPEKEDRDREIAPTEDKIATERSLLQKKDRDREIAPTSRLNRILGWVERLDRRGPSFRSMYRRTPT